jgi:hypothetical protein
MKKRGRRKRERTNGSAQPFVTAVSRDGTYVKKKVRVALLLRAVLVALHQECSGCMAPFL